MAMSYLRTMPGCRRRTSLLIATFLLLGAPYGVLLTAGQLNDSTTAGQPSVTDATPSSPNRRPIDKGLKPLYVMTSTFLDVVHPESRGFVLDDSRFDDVFAQQSLAEGFSIVSEKSQEEWQYYPKHYIGFAVCVAFGVVFIVLMPIVGLCVCACRCCGRCGAAPRYTDTKSKRDTCRRTSCSLLLLVLTTLLTAGMVCAFVTNQLIHEQTTSAPSNDDSEDQRLIPALTQILRNLEVYQRATANELDTGILQPVNDIINSIKAQLSGFPDRARDKLSSITKSIDLLDAATALADSLERISDDLVLITEYTGSLREEQRALNRSLEESRSEVVTALDTSPICRLPLTKPDCDKIRSQLNDLRLAVDYTQFDNVSQQLYNVRDVIDHKFRVHIEQAKDDYANISSRILNEMEQTISGDVNDVQRVVNETSTKIKERVQSYIKSAAEVINSINLTTASAFLQDSVAPEMSTYGNYRYYVGIALSCMLLLIAACMYLGLCFGACGDSVTEGAGVCNRGVGARLLLAGVAFTFLFSWLLMIALILLFVTGGMTYTEVCRPMTRPQENRGFYRAADWLLNVTINDDRISLTYMGVMDRCQRNDGIYSALNLDRAVNLSSQFNAMKGDVRSLLDSLMSKMNSSSATDHVNLLTPEVRQLMDELANSGLNDINFTKYDMVLSSSLLTTNLSEVIASLNETAAKLAANPLAAAASQNLRRVLIEESIKLQHIADVNVTRINNLTAGLRAVLRKLRHEIQPDSGDVGFANRTYDLINALNTTQSFIRVNGTSVMREFVRSFASDLYDSTILFLSRLLDQVQYRMGRCRPLYDAVQGVTAYVCSTFLNPYNGFWFSIGWCLAFSLPTIIVAIYLSSLYFATDDFYGTSHSKSYDDATIDAYDGVCTPDDIPLDDVRHRRIYPSNAHNNTVYEPDINPPPPATLYQQAAQPQVRPALQDPGFIHPAYAGMPPAGSRQARQPPQYDFYYAH